MNICRPIILHNEFLPAITGERTWEYRALGHYDGITVEQSICIEKYENLKTLFDICLKNEEESIMYCSQILLGFHTKSEDEEKFWERKLPFIYLVLIQLSDVQVEKCQRYLESKEFLIKELSRLKRQDEIEETYITTYYSLDNSDLIAVIKCGHADTGAALINSLHQIEESNSDVQILNSYSVFGVYKEEIEEPGLLIEENEPVNMMELQIIESDNNRIRALYDRLMEELAVSENGIEICANTLLGTEDGSIPVKNIPWKLLLSLYREKTGILNNSNEQGQKYASAVSTKIITPLANPGKAKKENSGKPKSDDDRFCLLLKKKIDVVYRKKNNTGWPAEKKNLIMFVKALVRFENAHYTGKEFSDYNFFTLYLPFYTFIKLLGEDDGSRSKDYYAFMKSLRLRTQSFAKPDRIFLQIADFNMRYFDIPVKFITLYSAYIYYFKQVLNTKKKKYEFLLCPGMNSQIGVEELFLEVSQKSRLFHIEIPEQQMYNLKQTFITIGHEIAHFVGTDVRSRDVRLKHMVNLCGRATALSMKNYLGKMDDFVLENAEVLELDSLETKLCEWISFYIEREQNKKYLRGHKYHGSITDGMMEKNLKNKRKYSKHLDVLRERMISAVEEMLLDHGQDIFGYIFNQEFYKYEGRIGYENRENFLTEKNEMLWECIHRFVQHTSTKNQVLTISNAMDNIIYLVKECYADMICILTLRLTLKDYLEAITEIIDESSITTDKLTDTNLIARVAIVMSVIGHSIEKEPDSKGEESLFRWTNEEFDYRTDQETLIGKLENAANTFAYTYIQGEIIILPDDIIYQAVGIIYDHKILMEIITYLLKCRRKYFRELKGGKLNSIRHVQDIYTLSQKRESGDFFGELMNMIGHYEADVYADLQKIVSLEK